MAAAGLAVVADVAAAERGVVEVPAKEVDFGAAVHTREHDPSAPKTRKEPVDAGSTTPAGP